VIFHCRHFLDLSYIIPFSAASFLGKRGCFYSAIAIFWRLAGILRHTASFERFSIASWFCSSIQQDGLYFLSVTPVVAAILLRSFAAATYSWSQSTIVAADDGKESNVTCYCDLSPSFVHQYDTI
jgi:hypothetical protein